MNTFRYLLVIFLLTTTAAIINLRRNADIIPRCIPLNTLPHSIGTWYGYDLSIDTEVISVLGQGEFLSRIYTKTNELAPINLFIGYFPTQRTGQTIHSPKNCLPGAGWTFKSSHYSSFLAANGSRYKVGEYLIENGESKEFVVYWYQAHGRSVPGEYMAKIHMVIDAIRTNRTDGALVRVITPVSPNETIAQAKDRALSFCSSLAPYLSEYIPN